jgi:hypothetical protein
MIDQMVQDALRRISEYINRACGQHMRAMKGGK